MPTARDLLYFEMRKKISQVSYGKQPTARANVDACSQEYSGIIFSILKKTLVKRKTLLKIVLTNKVNSEHIHLKMFEKNAKISKPFDPFYTIQSLNFFPSANHDNRHFFDTLAPNYYSAATALAVCILSLYLSFYQSFTSPCSRNASMLKRSYIFAI